VIDVLPPAVDFAPALREALGEALAPCERGGASRLELELADQFMRVSVAQELGAVVADHEVWEGQPIVVAAAAAPELAHRARYPRNLPVFRLAEAGNAVAHLKAER